ncbi:MAG: alpha/beta hydrolase [Chitinophagaceae bacterium]|nr:alpha/beta hydrolase [Chitinophagaceae bacterium]
MNFTYQSASIHYRVIGQGKPVLLIHGFGEDGSVWDHQVEFLKEHYRLIIPDLPGSGRSELIPDMSIEGMAEMIKNLMNHVAPVISPTSGDLEGVVLLGHSMGGYITLALVEKFPELFSKFGLVHSSAFADSEEKRSARAKSISFIEEHGAYEFLKTSIPGLFYRGQDGSKPSTPDIERGQDGSKPSDPYAPMNTLIEKGKAFSTQSLVAYYQAMIARPDRTAVLRSFPGPVLFLIGLHDAAVPFEQSLQQCYLPDQAHIHILRHSAHMGMLEQKEDTNNFLLAFLA